MDIVCLTFDEWEPGHWQFSYRGDIEKADEKYSDGLELLEDGALGKAALKFRAALVRFPEHIGAIMHLGYTLKLQGKPLEAWAFVEMAVSVARAKIPAAFSWDGVVISWYEGENRAYLRACLQLGIELMERGYHERASCYFEHVLMVWPNDNLGVRYVAPDCYLRMGAYDKVVALVSRYADEDSPYLIYAVPLAQLKAGRTDEARKAMARAVARRPKVAQELLRQEHTPPADMSPLGTRTGGADEAYSYWQGLAHFWQPDSQAIALLRSVAEEAGVQTT